MSLASDSSEMSVRSELPGIHKDVLQYITLGVVVVMGVVIVVMGIVVAGGCSSFTHGVC